ncbi:TOTE conflict system archaeo-eukaryotic primase domain-containing protein [Clostridium sporogenes]|uniref:TOTE conflict system archaeo-eukaryotic primase domain-containing protein n=1 Tax=Clostridium sporogenes TaxID=1509 RepID=UPI002239122B|nr:MucR family transcriptional regulator [Clostridium sporogenes]MCW6078085.1 hypothetical protein [Clostridium sporogenes]
MKIDYKKYKKIEELFIQESIKDLTYDCPVCGKEMKSIHLSHLKTHNLTKEEFVNTYGLPNDVYLKRYILDLIIDKIYSLYITNTDKWVKLSEATLQYSTIEKGADYFRKFNRGDIKRHLKGRDAIGIFSLKSCSKFLIFDIDAYHSKYDAMEIANNINHVLAGYFPKEEIHITFSGNKGYHIELFFDKLVAIKDLQELFNIVLNEIDIEKYKGVNVEIRPELKGKDGKGIKLPLGINHKNEMGNNYCYFVDEDLEQVENEIEYILNIKKSDNSFVYEMISDYNNMDLKPYKNGYLNNQEKVKSENEKTKDIINKTTPNIINSVEIDYSRVGIKNYLENGLTQIGTRHNISFLIALYLKAQGHDINESKEILFKWSMEQVEREMSNGNISEINRDIRGILKGVYDIDKNYHLSISKKEVYITQEDRNKLEALNLLGKEFGIKVFSHQKILYAMLIHGKRYSDETGKFYMTYDQIQQITDIKSRNSICKCISELGKWGYIDIVERNVKKEGSKKNVPNVYRIKLNDNEEVKGRYKICNNKDICKDCFYNMINKLYSKDTIDKVITRGVKSKVLKVRDSCCFING